MNREGILTDWRLSAGDEHTVFDGRQNRLAQVPCGGMSGRTFDEGVAAARLIAAAPELLEVLQEVFANHDKVNSLDWTNRACAAMTKALKP